MRQLRQLTAEQVTIADAAIVAAAENAAEVTVTWGLWLREARWDWWATPSCAYPVTPTQLLHRVTEWLLPFPTAYAVFGLQYGPRGDRLHTHVVIGGTGRHPSYAAMLRRTWWGYGNLKIAPYSPARGGVEYLVRQADEIELFGTPVPYVPRRHTHR